MNNLKSQSITDALEEARSLISEEYQALINDDLKERYEYVLEKLREAIGYLKND